MRRMAISRWLTAPTFFVSPTTAAAEQLSIAELRCEMGRIKVVGIRC